MVRSRSLRAQWLRYGTQLSALSTRNVLFCPRVIFSLVYFQRFLSSISSVLILYLSHICMHVSFEERKHNWSFYKYHYCELLTSIILTLLRTTYKYHINMVLVGLLPFIIGFAVVVCSEPKQFLRSYPTYSCFRIWSMKIQSTAELFV